MVSIRRRRNLGLSSGNNSCQNPTTSPPITGAIGSSSTPFPTPYETVQPQDADISNLKVSMEIGTSSKMADDEEIHVPNIEASPMVIDSDEPTVSGVQRYNQPSEDQSLFTNYDPSYVIFADPCTTLNNLPSETIASDKTQKELPPSPSTQTQTTSARLLNLAPLIFSTFNITILPAPTSDHPKLEKFCTEVFNKVKNLVDESSQSKDAEEIEQKWDSLRTEIDEALVKMKTSGIEKAQANKDALTKWFLELIKNMEQVDLRRNKNRHLPSPSDEATPSFDPYFFMSESPLLNPNREDLSDLPMTFSDPRPQQFVSSKEFNRVTTEIRTQLAILSAIIQTRGNNSCQNLARDENSSQNANTKRAQSVVSDITSVLDTFLEVLQLQLYSPRTNPTITGTIGSSSTPFPTPLETVQPQDSDISNLKVSIEIGTSSEMVAPQSPAVEENQMMGAEKISNPSHQKDKDTASNDALSLLNDPTLETNDLMERSQVIDHFTYGNTKPSAAFLAPRKRKKIPVKGSTKRKKIKVNGPANRMLSAEELTIQEEATLGEEIAKNNDNELPMDIPVLEDMPAQEHILVEDELPSADCDVVDDPGSVGIGENAFIQYDNGLKVGMQFTSLASFKEAVRDHTIRRQKLIKWVKNEKLKAKAKCKQEECNWQILCRRVGKGDIFQIKTFNDVHSCVIVATKNNQAKKAWVFNNLKDKIRDQPEITLGQVDAFLKCDFNLTVSETTIIRALNEARAFNKARENDSCRSNPA